MKSFVITIQGLKQSVDMAERCITSASKFGIEVQTFPAITPADEPELFLRSNGIPLTYFQEKWSYYERVLSCFSSHFSLWKKCLEMKENFLIFEHDAVVVNEIPLDLNFAGVLSFGHPSYGKFITPSKLGVQKLISKQYFPGAHAYLMKPEAAQKVIEVAKLDAHPADVFFHNARFPFLEEFYPWPVVVRDTFSTVQNKYGVLAKHQYAKNPNSYKLVNPNGK